jgi:hypothetical protein
MDITTASSGTVNAVRSPIVCADNGGVLGLATNRPLASRKRRLAGIIREVVSIALMAEGLHLQGNGGQNLRVGDMPFDHGLCCKN